MPKTLLPVPHCKQTGEGDCLPACVAMVLEYLNQPINYDALLKILQAKPYGTPAQNIQHLTKSGFSVTYGETSLEGLAQHLADGQPCIVFVRTGDLPYWSYATSHAVVVVGIDDDNVYLNDPYFEKAPQCVSHGEFLLAWSEFDYTYAVITR